MPESDTRQEKDALRFDGAPVKHIGGGKIEGYLIMFSGPDDPDLVGDFFTTETNFGNQKSTPIYYDHGMDSQIGLDEIGQGTWRVDAKGVWLEAQLDKRQAYVEDVLKLVEDGKLGYSSGTLGHLTKFVKTPNAKGGYAWHVKNWPLGGDASLTPTPAEPRTSAAPMKSYKLQQEAKGSEGGAPPAAPASGGQQPKTEIKMSEPLTKEAISSLILDAIKADRTEQSEAAAKAKEAKELEELRAELKALKEGKPEPDASKNVGGAPNIITSITEDSFDNAFKAWALNGQVSEPIKGMAGKNGEKSYLDFSYGEAVKASNAVTMVAGTAAAGGNAIPTGHFSGIIAKKRETAVSDRVGVLDIPGKGTTVNVPWDNEADGEFVSTAESADYDKDSPAIGLHAMTLGKYTKNVFLSEELLEDEDSALMPFIEAFVGAGWAKTDNNLLVTEVMANGTNLKTFASATAFAAGEIEDMEANDTIGDYLDGNVNFVMRNSTFGLLRKIYGDAPVYRSPAEGGPSIRTNRALLEYPVYRTNKAAAVATTTKPILFGDFSYVGRRTSNMRVLRNPYLRGSQGEIVLHYSIRQVYKVLQADAIGYGTMA